MEYFIFMKNMKKPCYVDQAYPATIVYYIILYRQTEIHEI